MFRAFLETKFVSWDLKIEDKFDLFVIGGGSGGVRAARFGASQGLKVGCRRMGLRWNLCK